MRLFRLLKVTGIVILLAFLGFHYVRIFMTGFGWGHDGTFGGAYRIDGSDGRSLLLVFVPKSMDVLSIYRSSRGQCEILATAQGKMANRIVWRFWYNDFRGWPVLYAREPFVPVILELMIGVRNGDDCDSFPPAGSKLFTRVDFDGNRARFQDMLLTRDAEFGLKRYAAQIDQLREQAVAAGYRRRE